MIHSLRLHPLYHRISSAIAIAIAIASSISISYELWAMMLTPQSYCIALYNELRWDEMRWGEYN